MNLPAEHPQSEHRNLIGMQRAGEMSTLGRQVAKYYKEGYCADADRVLDMMTELQAVWDNERN